MGSDIVLLGILALCDEIHKEILFRHSLIFGMIKLPFYCQETMTRDKFNNIE